MVYKKALEILEQIKTNDSDAIHGLQVDINKVRRMLAVWYEKHDKFEIAKSMYNRVLDFHEKETTDDPDSSEAKRNLILIHTDIGIIYLKSGLLKDAIKHLQTAHSICDPLMQENAVFLALNANACRHLSRAYEETGDNHQALQFISLAEDIYAVLKMNHEFFMLRYAATLLGKAIILSVLYPTQTAELKELYSEILAIYNQVPNIHELEHRFSCMVAYYKLANIYAREYSFEQAAQNYEKCMEVLKSLENTSNNEETASQIAIIYLDFGILWYGRDDGKRDLEKALYYFDAAQKYYSVLSEINAAKYNGFYTEARERINVIQGLIKQFGDVNSPKLHNTISAFSYSTDFDEKKKRGNSAEEQGDNTQAHRHHRVGVGETDIA